ncbi:MAG: hypothetical protein H0A75_08475 [Candidatus Methanofishera endochildressiae]|uniref:RlmG N-terminal domain-containing protein n=1 Tax=Candidatus Methanofishera endochildressiae TaxID=2738884 RepID=A0A7Z0MQ86_9GAMM|nr:hypothetical protein [Candidatus Methanofishera endochildressiae]
MLNDLTPKLQRIENPRLLIVNDSFGALAVALHTFSPYCISDSFISLASIAENLAQNQQVIAQFLTPKKARKFFLSD